jgi:hypothetical protein
MRQVFEQVLIRKPDASARPQYRGICWDAGLA